MTSIEIKEQDSKLEFTNGIVRLEYNLNQGLYHVWDVKDEKKIVENASSEILFGDKEYDPLGKQTGLISCSSKDQFKKSWHVEDYTEKNGKKGKSLSIELSENPARPSLNLKFFLLEEESSIFIQIEVENSLAEELRIESLHPLHLTRDDNSSLTLGSKVSDWRIFKNDWQSWSQAKVIKIFDSDHMTRIRLSRLILYSNPDEKRSKGLVSCEYFAAIHNLETKQNLVCGFITLKDQFCQILMRGNKKKNSLELFTTRCQADGVPIEKNQTLKSEKLAIYFRSNGNELSNINKYFTMVATQNDAVPWPTVQKGWCSWYHYYQNITEEETLKNLEFISSHSTDIPVDLFQLDDGYQIRAGEWDPNNKFPGGMEQLARKITEKGYVAGLWLAPFFVSTKSALVKEHPDWFLKKRGGRRYVVSLEGFENKKSRVFSALRTGCLALDPTHPEVQEWLRALFKKVRAWGIRYIKIDFVYAAALQGERYNPRMTRAQAYRKGLEIIRDAIGKDSLILGCGAPLGPAIGIVNAMRVSTDTAPAWNPILRRIGIKVLRMVNLPSVLSAMHNNILLSFMHKKLWINDPDCLMMRDHDTSLNEDEFRSQISIIGLTNGLSMVSDDFSHVSSERIKLIKVFQPLNLPIDSALPLDLFESTLTRPPRFYGVKIKRDFEEWWILGIINWENSEELVKVPFSLIEPKPNRRYHVFDFWSQNYFIGTADDAYIMYHMKPHSCELISVREVKEIPQLISSSFHFTQGAELSRVEYDSQAKKLTIEIHMKGSNAGTLTFFTPENRLPNEIKTNAVDYKQEPLLEGYFKIDLIFTDHCQIELNF